MHQSEFLQDQDVSSFVDWLIERLPSLAFRLNFSASRFVPGGLSANVVGIEQVLDHYVWKTSWKDDGELVQSDSWHSTRHSLQRLRTKLIEAAQAEDNDAMLVACFAVLEWGGVSGAKPFLRRKAADGRLVQYLCDVQAVVALNTHGNLADINKQVIERYDSGLTKIHALFDTTGSPIYDSRVGAAMAMLYALYRDDAGSGAQPASPALRFPSGAARGAQIRDPHALNAHFPAAPQFYTAGVSHVAWAQSQVKLGWIMQEVIKRTDWFYQDGADMASSCHAFEAALFMIGYDLRCLSNTSHAVTGVAPTNAPPGPKPARTNWVPTSHGFSTIFLRYVEYRMALARRGERYDDAGGAGFRDWLQLHGGPYTANTLHAYCYPLRQSEFDLFERPIEEIAELDRAIATGDTARIKMFLDDFNIQTDERRHVCLIDVWCVGYLKDQGWVRAKEIMIAAGIGGTRNAVNLVWNVGSNVGRYLRLLDQDNYPTALFHDYFADKTRDLADRLRQAM